MQKLTATKLFKVVAIAIFLGLLIFFNPVKFFEPGRSLLAELLSPLKKIAYTVAAAGQGIGEFVSSIGELKTENQTLLLENQRLQAQQAQLQDVQNENNELRVQLDLLPRGQFNLLPAEVISQNLDGMGNWLEINKGSDDGLREEMPVVVSQSILVGRLQEVTAKTAKVVLLTNPKSIVNIATVQTGARGVARGEYGLGVIFDMILQTDLVQNGDEVVTSGLGSSMPRGLLVGTIQNVHKADDNLFQQATIISPIKVSKLQLVFVILSSK